MLMKLIVNLKTTLKALIIIFIIANDHFITSKEYMNSSKKLQIHSNKSSKDKFVINKTNPKVRSKSLFLTQVSEKNSLYKNFLFDSISSMRISEGSIRVFNASNFKVSDISKDYVDYNKGTVNLLVQKLRKKGNNLKYSVVVGPKTKLLVAYNKKERKFTREYTANTLISVFPIENNIDTFYLTILSKGQSALFTKSNYEGDITLVDINEKHSIKEFKLKDFNSYITGLYTAIRIPKYNVFLNESNPLASLNTLESMKKLKEEDKFIISIEMYDSNINRSISVNGNCIIMYSFSFFEENIPDKDLKPIYFCSDYFDNEINPALIANHGKHKKDEEFCHYCLYELSKNQINSIIVGNNVVAVAFSNIDHQGSAMPINQAALNLNTSYVKNPKSVYILKENCIILFSQSFYTGSNTILCSSIDSVNIAISALFKDLKGFGSMIVGKNTIITVYDQEKYSGKTAVYTTHEPEFYFKVSSIKIISSYETIKLKVKPDEHIVGKDCFVLYELKDFQGKSLLRCGNQRTPSDITFNSVKVSNNKKIYIKYNNGNTFNSNQSITIIEDKRIIEDRKNLSLKITDVLSVNKGCIIIFEKKKYEGNNITICENSSNILLDENNNLLSYKSIVVGKDTEVELFRDFNYLGTPVKINNDVAVIKNTEFAYLKLELYSVKFKDKAVEIEVFNSNSKIVNFFIGFISGLFLKGNLKNNEREEAQKEINECFPKIQLLDDNKETIDIDFEEYSNDMSEFTSSNNDKKEKDNTVRESTSRFSFIKDIRNKFCNVRLKATSFIADIVSLLSIEDPIEELKDRVKSGIKEKIIEVAENTLFVEADKDSLIETNISVTKKQPKDKSFKKSSTLINNSKTQIRRRYRKKKYKRHQESLVKVSKWKVIFIKIKDYIINKLKEVYNTIKNGLIKIFGKIIKWMYKLFKFVEKFNYLYEESSCEVVIGWGKEKFEKINNYISFISTAFTFISGFGIFMLVDLFLAQMCQYKEFKYAMSHFALARKVDDTKKWTLYGEGLGTLFNSVIDATPISLSVVEALNSFIKRKK